MKFQMFTMLIMMEMVGAEEVTLEQCDLPDGYSILGRAVMITTVRFLRIRSRFVILSIITAMEI